MSKGYYLVFSLMIIVSFVRAHQDYADSSLSAISSRILGGVASTSTVNRGAVASVRSSSVTGQSHICGGFIINRRWVGTAAQCVSGRTASDTVVAVGTTSITAGVIYTLIQIQPHHNYNEQNLNHDIALLRTATEIVFSGNTIRSVPLNTQAVTGSVSILGWGRTTATGMNSATLLETTFNIVPHATCQSNFPYAYRRFINADRQICMSRTGVATCLGDAGSPIFFNGVVAGIASWVEPCVSGQTSVNTRISFYVDWILGFTANDD